jgi:hypothetical protein
MKDPQHYDVVSPVVFNEPIRLWDGFDRLVRKILLPIACVNVVHMDIRLNPDHGKWSICNILGCTILKASYPAAQTLQVHFRIL